MSQSELLNKVILALETARVPYMLTGSFASSLQGEPRSTHDIDIVVDASPVLAPALLRAFPRPAYYLDELSIVEALARMGQFNLLDTDEGEKVDFWLLTEDAFDRSRFARRYAEQIGTRRVDVSRPEDTILQKLRWSRDSGGSEKQLGDARGVYQVQREALDISYIDRWARTLDLFDDWHRLTRDAKID